MIFSTRMSEISIYIHVPFCRKRCAYCDFNTFAGIENSIPEYIDCLIKEINLRKHWIPITQRVHTIYFGGGTPSLLRPDQISRVLDEVRTVFDVSPDCEITMEANPGTINLDYLHEVKKAGVNRVSLGVQSLADEDLRLLGRLHNTSDVFHAVDWLRQADIENISIDLMFGLPHQTIESWEITVKTALTLEIKHISLYSLTIEEGTPFWDWLRRGVIPAPDDDLMAEMYELAGNWLVEKNFEQYEISNWSLKDGERKWDCAHNLQYWHNLSYLGFGAGAHSYINKRRIANISQVDQYIGKLSLPSVDLEAGLAVNEAEEETDQWEEMQETMMLGLRLTEEGVNKSTFKNRFNYSMEDCFQTQFSFLAEQGLLENLPDRIHLTARGRLLGNQVFMRFIGNPKPR